MNLQKFTLSGKFLMLALDHRESIKKIINAEHPEAVSREEIVKLKSAIIESLKDQATGLLIDAEYGLPAYKKRTKPFLLPLEKTGYTHSASSGQAEQAGERVTELEYSVQKLKDLGADGAKLLIYFNPTVPSFKTQLETARKAVADCKTHNFPLFLEIVTYGGEGLVLDSVKAFVQNGVVPDVFKLEYPGSEEASRLISGIVGNIPWILLTGGDSFDTFKEHLMVAVRSGAKGFLAGRALWQELPKLSGEEKIAFLARTLPERFKTLSEIAKGG